MDNKAVMARDCLIDNYKPKLSFNNKRNYKKWKEEIREKFLEVTGLNDIALNACEPSLEIESETQKDGYKEIKFSFYSEIGAVVPCYLLIPDDGKKKYPVVITLQGHSTGYHNSVGIKKYESDDHYQPRGEFAVQSVREGYATLAIEQRAMGMSGGLTTTRRDVRFYNGDSDDFVGNCYYGAMTGFMLGRSLIGERCWDVSRAIDVLSNFPECDLDKIAITGNSGGGTATYYAACYDERIKICMPASAFCPYRESILRFFHCACNYIPNAYKYFDMQDLSCLIAPRKLIIVNGQTDTGFLVEGARRGFETVKAVYKKENKEEQCKLIITPKGHWWCVDIIWPEMKKAFESIK